MSKDVPASGHHPLLSEAQAFRPALLMFFSRRCRDKADVEDLVQDVFLRIAARQSSERISNLGGYVFQTAASVLADRHRRRVTRYAESHIGFDDEHHGGVDLDVGQILESREALSAAATLLLQLPERTRTIFVLRRLEGRQYREIAAELGISVSAVEKHMVRAMERLAAARIG